MLNWSGANKLVVSAVIAPDEPAAHRPASHFFQAMLMLFSGYRWILYGRRIPTWACADNNAGVDTTIEKGVSPQKFEQVIA